MHTYLPIHTYSIQHSQACKHNTTFQPLGLLSSNALWAGRMSHHFERRIQHCTLHFMCNISAWGMVRNSCDRRMDRWVHESIECACEQMGGRMLGGCAVLEAWLGGRQVTT